MAVLRKLLTAATALLLCALPLSLKAEDGQHGETPASHSTDSPAQATQPATPADELGEAIQHATEGGHAEPGEHAEPPGEHAEGAHGAGVHHPSPAAEHLFDIPLGFTSLPVTNSMVTSWVISLAIIIFVRRLAGRPQIIPTRGQAVVENLLGGLRDIIEPIVGHRMIKVTFPLLIGFFIFILMQNWSGMLPGVGSVYYTNAAGEQVHLIRPGNADLNMTLGLALVHFVAWFYFVMRYAGPRALLYDVFGNKANPKEVPLPIYLFLFVIFLGVGMIELVSILFRNISLPFRLFGNVYGGENLIASMTGLIRYIVPVPFYFLEVLIGLVQALVFTLLVAVYIGLICNHEGGHEEEQHAAVE